MAEAVEWTCPVCHRVQPKERHAMDCHFTTMGRDLAITALIPPVRLNPEGTRAHCDHCGRDWLIGNDPDCRACRAVWAAIDAAYPQQPVENPDAS